ncbi:unnamed protein product [Polarella glacialis]|uniref:Uncharacterized protein n=1 Tax=Polarella glacialis TaxID=89957 RepID=A0A813FCF3_POLGL|nr:unnamed protein product [Polarella glacialis]
MRPEPSPRDLGTATARTEYERLLDDVEQTPAKEPEMILTARGVTFAIDERTGVAQETIGPSLWSDSEGIPVVLSTIFRWPRFLSWLAAVSICLLLPLAMLRLASTEEQAQWLGPLSTLSLDLTNCDAVFTASRTQKSRLTVTYWTWRGAIGNVVLDQSLHLVLRLPHRSHYFRCEAVFEMAEVQPGNFHAHTLKIKAEGSDEILLESSTQLAFVREADLRVSHADVRFAQLEAPRIAVHIRHGMLALRWDGKDKEVERPGVAVEVVSSFAQVALQAHGGQLSVTCDEDTGGQTVAHGVSLAVGGGRHTGLVARGVVEAHLSVRNASAVLRCIACEGSRSKVFRGSLQERPSMTHQSSLFLEHAAIWAHEQGSAPWIVYINAVGPDLRPGRWLVMSSHIYLAFPIHLFALLSGGMLAPHVTEITVNLMGLSSHLDSQCSAEGPKGLARMVGLRALSTQANHNNNVSAPVCSKQENLEDEAFELLWKWAVESQLVDARKGSLVFEPKDGEVTLVDKAMGIVDRSGVPVHMVWSLQLAAIFNVAGALIFTMYLLVLIQSAVLPWVKATIVETQLEVVASLRLSHGSSQGTWRLMVALVEGPHGFFVRWVSRPKQADFSRILVIARGTGPGGAEHNFSFYASRTHVSAPERKSVVRSEDQNQADERYVVQIQVTSAANTEDTAHPFHEALRPWFQYTFRLQGLDNLGASMEVSAWSSEVVLSPPWTVFDYPQLFSQVFFPIEVPSFELFLDQFCSIHEMDCCVALADVEIVFNNEPDHAQLCLQAAWKDCESPDASVQGMAHLRQDPKFLGIEQHREWYSGFAAETMNIFGESVEKLAQAGATGANDHVLDVGKVFSSRGGQRVDREAGRLMLPRTDMNQSTIMLSVTLPSGEPVAQGSVNHKQLLERWAEQRNSWAHMEPFEVQLEGAKLRCNVLLGSSRRMLEMPKNIFTTVAPGELWFHGHEQILGWSLPALLSSLTELGFLEKPEVGPADALVFTLEAKSFHGSDAVRMAGEYEADLLKLFLEVPNDHRLIGTFQLRLDTVWVQPRHELARLAEGTTKQVGFERERRGFRWCKLQELHDSGTIHVKDTAGWTTQSVQKGPWRERQEALNCLSTHNFLFEKPVLIQEFELAYAAWCKQNRLSMQQIDEHLLEENSVLPIHLKEMQLKVVQGLRPALPFEYPLRYLLCDGGLHVSTADIHLEEGQGDSSKTPGREDEGGPKKMTLTSQAHSVQVLQGFRWQQKSWSFEADLASRSSYAWLLRSRVPKSHRIQRAGVAAFGWLESTLSFFMQLLLFMLPALLSFLVVVLDQRYGLMFQPSFMMRAQLSP